MKQSRRSRNKRNHRRRQQQPNKDNDNDNDSHNHSHNNKNNNNSSPTSTPPPRIGLQSSTLSLREQLKQVQQTPSSPSSASTSPVVRTSFRRRKTSSHLLHNHTHISSNRSRQHTAHIDLPSGKYDIHHHHHPQQHSHQPSPSPALPPLILIDGYNVVGVWPRLRKWRDRSDLPTARRLLEESVAEFSAVRGWHCVIVYDAMHYRRNMSLPTEERQHITNNNNNKNNNTSSATADTKLTVVFAATETADAYIERSVATAVSNGDRQVWAATSDMLQARVSGAFGAHVMSATLFVQELKRARKDTRERLQAHRRTDGDFHRGRMLMSSVDPDTRARLYRLRDALDG